MVGEQLLRSTLDSEGHEDVKLVVPDAQSWDILRTFDADPDFLNSVDIIGQDTLSMRDKVAILWLSLHGIQQNVVHKNYFCDDLE